VATRRRKKPAARRDAGWSIDRGGRWRDERGRFASRERVLDTLAAAASTDDVARMLKRSAKRLKGRGGKQRYVIQAQFAGVGWRTLAASADLKTVLEQSASWLSVDMSLRLNDYVKLDKAARRAMRRGESPEPQIVDVQIVPIGPDKLERKAAKRKSKKGKRK
jgi:hypothetical protein